MTNSYPPNPFNSQNENSDTRNSRLFATGQNNENYRVDNPTYEIKNTNKSKPVISSRRELRIKKSELRRNILIAISIFIGLIMALIATDTWKLGTGEKPYFSKSLSSVSPLESQSIRVAGEQIEKIRELSADNPLRVYIGGDSLVGSFGKQLASSLGESGTIKATYDSRVSSGLVNKSFFNWENYIKKIVASYNPEVIIFMIGTNDASLVSTYPNDYKNIYKKHLENFLEIVQENDRKAIFVLAPKMKEPLLNKNLEKINDVIEKVAKDKSALVVNSGKVLSPSGQYVSSIKLNKKINVRSPDGVHVSTEGGTLLAQLIENFLFSKYGLDRFYAPTPIKAIKVPGCCTTPNVVPSGSTRPNSSSSITSTSSSTTSTSAPVDTGDTDGPEPETISE